MSKCIKALLIGICLLVFFIFFAILGILFYVHSDHAGRQIQARINDRIPGKVIFKDYTLAMNKGRIELGNILLEDPQGRVVAGIDQLVLQVLWKELFYRNIAIEQIFIKNPQVRLIIDPDGSLSLLGVFAPQRTEKNPVPSEKPDKFEPSFNLVIHDFLLENGSFSFENKSEESTANLESIRMNFSGDFGEQNWLLDLSAGKGIFQSPKVQTKVEMIKLSGAIQEEQINDLKLEIKTPSSNIELTGSARDILSEPKAELIMDIALHVPEIREAFFLEKQYTGNITGHLSAKGLVKNPEISLTLSHSGGQLGDFTMEESSIQAMVQDRIVRLAPMELKFGTGSIRVNAKSDLSGVFPEGFMVQPESFESLSYDLNMVVNDVNLKDTLSGRFQGKGIIGGTIFAEGNGISTENAFADIKIDLSGHEITTGTITPVDIQINSTAALKQGKAFLDIFEIQAGETELSASGNFDIASKGIEAHIHVDSKNLERSLTPLGIKGAQGALKLEAKASGTLDKPVADLQLTGKNLAFDNLRLGNVQISSRFSDGILMIQEAELENQNSRLKISGTLGIFEKHQLTLLDDPVIDLKINTDSFFLENFVDQVQAKVSLKAQIEGTMRSPRGNYELTAENIFLSGQDIESILIKGNLEDKKIHFAPLQILLASDQSIDGSGWLSTDRNFQFQLVSKGIFLNQIHKIQEQDLAEGLLVINFAGEGTLDDPRVTGRMAIEDLTVNQKDVGNFQLDLKISDFLAIASGRLNFDFSAAYHLNKKDFTIDIDFDDTDLSPYFNLSDLKDFSGKISGKINASGNTSDIKQTKGSGNFLFMNLFIKEQELVHAENFEIVFRNNQLLIPGLNIRLLDGGNLNIEASADLDGPLRVKADGTIPLEGLQMVRRALPDISGLVQISADVSGTTAKPDIQGEILLDQIGFTIPELLQKVHDVRGKIVITPEALKLEKIQGRLDTGRLELAGNLTLKDLSPEKIKLDLTAVALPVKVPDTLNVLLQSNLSLSGTPEKAFLEGNLIILEGVYYKDINVSLVEGVTQRKRQIAPQEPQATHLMLKNLNLDVAIRRRNPFLVDNNLAYLDINPDIRLTGTADQPLIQGRTTIESGTIQYQRKTFTVQKGVIDFINPYELEPTMDIKSTIKIRKWLVTMTLYGTPDNMVLTLTSDPPEEDGDILSLLILGKTTRELISSEGGTSRSAEQMAAELIADTLGEDIKKITGLDFFEVETERDDEPEEESEGVMVTIGKKLSDRLTVKYALDSRTGDMIQRAISEYQLLENIIMSVFQDSAGIFGGELQYRLEFR
jgi:translocation and assembly module TamB